MHLGCDSPKPGILIKIVRYATSPEPLLTANMRAEANLSEFPYFQICSHWEKSRATYFLLCWEDVE